MSCDEAVDVQHDDAKTVYPTVHVNFARLESRSASVITPVQNRKEQTWCSALAITLEKVTGSTQSRLCDNAASNPNPKPVNPRI